LCANSTAQGPITKWAWVKESKQTYTKYKIRQNNNYHYNNNNNNSLLNHMLNSIANYQLQSQNKLCFISMLPSE
jgi:hypothetical protein